MEYLTPHKVIFENAFYRLLCFREVNEHTTSLGLPARAGHWGDFCLDFDKNKSVVECALRDSKGGVYTVCPKAGSMFRFESIRCLLLQMVESINIIDDGAVHLFGICQGGALAAIFATNYPDYVKELTVVAAPIDSSFESIITPATKIPLVAYQAVVMSNFGVMPGWLLLKAWWDQNKAHHEVEQKKPKNAHFYKKYKDTQTISGAWYLEWVLRVFKKRLVEELNITCKTNAIYGLNDDITTSGQVLALQECCDSEVNFYTVNKGHMGTFASVEALEPGGVWSAIFKGVK